MLQNDIHNSGIYGLYVITFIAEQKKKTFSWINCIFLFQSLTFNFHRVTHNQNHFIIMSMVFIPWKESLLLGFIVFSNNYGEMLFLCLKEECNGWHCYRSSILMQPLVSSQQTPKPPKYISEDTANMQGLLLLNV